MVLGIWPAQMGESHSHSLASCGREEVGSESDSHYTPAPLHSRRTQERKHYLKEGQIEVLFGFYVLIVYLFAPIARLINKTHVFLYLSHIVSEAERIWITESESAYGGRRW